MLLTVGVFRFLVRFRRLGFRVVRFHLLGVLVGARARHSREGAFGLFCGRLLRLAFPLGPRRPTPLARY